MRRHDGAADPSKGWAGGGPSCHVPTSLLEPCALDKYLKSL